MIHGYDISNVNGEILIPNDAEFVICKVTQDSSFVDKLFDLHKASARQREIGFGGYHYADINAQPDPQASCNFFLSHLGDQLEGEIAALDVEIDTGAGGLIANDPRNRDWVTKWGAYFHEQKGYKPKLYVSKSGIADFDLDHPSIAEFYDLWYAWWPFVDDILIPPPAPSPFKDYKLWQYNADGIDKDKFLGTLEEFKATGFGHQEAPQSVDYEALYWTPIMTLINQMVANPKHAHSDAAFHAVISNAITQHKITYGVESPD